jgi:hypothetical protein
MPRHRLVGPAFTDIAARYRLDPRAHSCGQAALRRRAALGRALQHVAQTNLSDERPPSCAVGAVAALIGEKVNPTDDTARQWFSRTQAHR